ncbi:unnamed protein product [Cuscuta campestris]|uniref:TF-B3 domain-containing protein n=1 Tax=Cuscuta campestris TaxID=132261 RepID=A0A484NJW8_9ASTE|nr:unnamed protein product [Cuscuta campestris]
MAKDNNGNSYEEARKQRVLENKKRFEDLGILNISKGLSDIAKPEKKVLVQRARRIPNATYVLEPRRSSRVRNPVQSYHDDLDVELPSLRKRSRSSSSSWASYLARPIEEVKVASYEERTQAYKAAEKLQSNLQSGNPSFIKSMVRSHVYSCFWLGLPNRFCEVHLPKSTVEMVLEDEEGGEYDAVFISKRAGLSGGWRAFALEHKLDDGDALVFDLVEPTKFKVYIVKASQYPSHGIESDEREEKDDEEEEIQHKPAKKGKKKYSANSPKEVGETEKPSRRNTRSCSITAQQVEIVAVDEETKGKGRRKNARRNGHL